MRIRPALRSLAPAVLVIAGLPAALVAGGPGGTGGQNGNVDPDVAFPDGITLTGVLRDFR